MRFNQTLSNYLKVSVGSDTYNLTKYDKISIIDITEIISPNSGGYLLQKWNIKCNDKNNKGKVQNFIRSSINTTPSPDTGASNIPPIGNAYMYIETSNNNHGLNVYSIIERTDIIQISNISFYYNRFSGDENNKAMGRFRVQLLKENSFWLTRYTIPKNDNYTTQSQWKLLNLNFAEDNYGIRLIYDQIDNANCDMCFSNILITHSVY